MTARSTGETPDPAGETPATAEGATPTATTTEGATPDVTTDAAPGEVKDWEAEALKHQNLARKEEARSKANYARVQELEAAAAKAARATMTEQERAVAEAVEQAKTEQQATYAEERKRNAVRARAAGKLENPDAAYLFLAETDLDPGDDDAVDAAIDQLLQDEPYLKGGGAKPKPKVGADGGPKGNGTKVEPGDMDMGDFVAQDMARRKAERE